MRRVAEEAIAAVMPEDECCESCEFSDTIAGYTRTDCEIPNCSCHVARTEMQARAARFLTSLEDTK